MNRNQASRKGFAGQQNNPLFFKDSKRCLGREHIQQHDVTIPHWVLLTLLPPCELHVISLKRTELACTRAHEVTVTLSPRPRATPLMPTPSGGKRSPPGHGGPSSPRCALPDIPHTRGGCPAAPSDGGRRGSPPGGYPRSRSRSAARAGTADRSALRAHT